MKKVLGIVLIAIGIVMLVYTGFKYNTKEKVVDLGSIEINTTQSHTLHWPPVAGFVFIAVGVGAIVLNRKPIV